MTPQAPVIMLVDDDPDFLEMNRDILEMEGYATVCCRDPQSALEAMRKAKPALVITDLMMEKLDSGFSFSRMIKEDPAIGNVPVIIVTAVGSRLGFDFRPHTPDELAAMHVDAYFDKPVDPQALLSKIHELLNGPTPEGAS